MIFHATLRGLFAAVDHIVDLYCMSVSACGAHCLLPLHEFVYTIVHSYCNILNATIMLSLCVWSLFVYVSVAVYLSVRLSRYLQLLWMSLCMHNPFTYFNLFDCLKWIADLLGLWLS